MSCVVTCGHLYPPYRRADVPPSEAGPVGTGTHLTGVSAERTGPSSSFAMTLGRQLGERSFDSHCLPGSVGAAPAGTCHLGALFHHPWGSRPVSQTWREVRKNLSGTCSFLCVPESDETGTPALHRRKVAGGGRTWRRDVSSVRAALRKDTMWLRPQVLSQRAAAG